MGRGCVHPGALDAARPHWILVARGRRHLLYDRCRVLYLHEKEEVHAFGLSPVGARWLYLPVLLDLSVRARLRKCA